MSAVDIRYESTPPWDLGKDRDFEVAYGKMTTWPGLHYVDPMNPDPEAIDIRDIAHSLSMTCRFAGHIPAHYSVAQHSIIVASYFKKPAERLVGLLHDAEETYFGDMASPLKKNFPDYKAAANNCRDVILNKWGLLGLYQGIYGQVKAADNEVYTQERKYLWHTPDDVVIPAHYVPLPAETANAMFLTLFYRLMRDHNAV